MNRDMAPEAVRQSVRAEERMSASTRQETIPRPNASSRAAAGPVYRTYSNKLNTQSATRQYCDLIDNAIDANLGTSGVGGHPSKTEGTHRKLKGSQSFARMLRALCNQNSIGSTGCISSTDADHSTSVLRGETRRFDIDTHLQETTAEDRSSDAHLLERKRDKALRFAMLVVGLSNLGIQIAQLM